ncbi:MAG: hypothetical protein ABUL66_01660, partial [Verrucomicrobiota bacterium]
TRWPATEKSGGGPPHSKTLARDAPNLGQLSSDSIFGAVPTAEKNGLFTKQNRRMKIFIRRFLVSYFLNGRRCR